MHGIATGPGSISRGTGGTISDRSRVSLPAPRLFAFHAREASAPAQPEQWSTRFDERVRTARPLRRYVPCRGGTEDPRDLRTAKR